MITRFILHLSFNCLFAVHTHTQYPRFPNSSAEIPPNIRHSSPPPFTVHRYFSFPCVHDFRSLSTLSYLSLPLPPQNRLLTHNPLPISWILTTVRGDQSEGGDPRCPVGCFDYGLGFLLLGISVTLTTYIQHLPYAMLDRVWPLRSRVPQSTILPCHSTPSTYTAQSVSQTAVMWLTIRHCIHRAIHTQ